MTPRAQRLPDPRGGDDRLARRRRRGAQQPAAAARDGVPDRRGGHRLRRAADVQRLRRRLEQAAGRRRRGRSCWPASATSPRAFATPPTRSTRSRPASPRTCARRSTSINALTTRIADLNRRIANVKGTGHAPNDLLDQRDTAIADLSKIAQVTTVGAADGTVGVFLGGGQKLVLGGEATALTALADPFDPAKVQIGITRRRHDARLSRRLHRRRLGRRPAARAEPRPRRCARPDRPDRLGDRRQPQRPAGARPRPRPARGPPARRCSRSAPPSVAPSSNNAQAGGVPVASYVNGLGVRVSSVSIAVVSTSELQPSDYELVADPALPAGSYRLTRLSDGTAQTVSDGSVVDGFRIDIADAGAGGARPLPAPAGLAGDAVDRARARRPEGHRRGGAGDGDRWRPPTPAPRAVASLAAVSASINPNLTATITFTDNSGNYSYSLVDTTERAADRQRHRQLRRRPADRAERLRADAERRSPGGDTLTVARTRVPGRRQRQRQRAARAARRDLRRRADDLARRRRARRQRHRRLCLGARGDRRARPERELRRRPVGGDRQRRRRRRWPRSPASTSTRKRRA